MDAQSRKAYHEIFKLKCQNLNRSQIIAHLQSIDIPAEIAEKAADDLLLEKQHERYQSAKEQTILGVAILALGIGLFFLIDFQYDVYAEIPLIGLGLGKIYQAGLWKKRFKQKGLRKH
ncbi:MAG: hypothetical protein AAF206_02005 [Bacteroidota bacterium]